MSVRTQLLALREALPEGVTLVAVSKTHPPEAIREAYAAGQRAFGESRPQELAAKQAALPGDIEWHMIGHLQTNKVKKVVGKVSLIQSVDSIKLLECIDSESQKLGMVSDVLLQVNTSSEQSKFGASCQELYKLAECAGALGGIKVRGIMTIAPLCDSTVSNRLHFDNTQQMYIDIKSKKYDNISMEYLSMGMSGDFEDAILSGSNMVRIGSGIFGRRF